MRAALILSSVIEAYPRNQTAASVANPAGDAVSGVGSFVVLAGSSAGAEETAINPHKGAAGIGLAIAN